MHYTIFYQYIASWYIAIAYCKCQIYTRKVFQRNIELSNGFLNSDKTTKAFPTFDENPLNHKTFTSLNFCR